MLIIRLKLEDSCLLCYILLTNLFSTNIAKMQQQLVLRPQLRNSKSQNKVCSCISFKYAHKSPNVVANVRCHVTKIVDTIFVSI